MNTLEPRGVDGGGNGVDPAMDWKWESRLVCCLASRGNNDAQGTKATVLDLAVTAESMIGGAESRR